MDSPARPVRRARAVPLLLTAIFLASEALLLGNVVLYVVNTRETRARAVEAADQAAVPQRIATVLGLATAAESAARGHALDGDPRHAAAYAEARRAMDGALTALEGAATSDAASQDGVARLRRLIAEELEVTERSFANAPSPAAAPADTTAAPDAPPTSALAPDAPPAPSRSTAQSAAVMAAIRAELDALGLRAERALQDRRAATNRAARLEMAAVIGVSALAMLVIALFYRRMRRYFEARHAAESALTATNDQLNVLVAERTAELTRLSQHLISIAEEEKAAFARELHDALGSNLTAVDIDVKWVEKKLREREPELAERLRRALVVLEQAVEVKRNVIEALRPSLLDMLGLGTALESLCEDFQRRSGVDCIPDLDQELPDLPPDVSIALYRVVQEALANVQAHAQATTVRVALHRESELLQLCVEDDGIGIPEDAFARSRSHGLVGMRERIRVLGGTFELKRGANGRGTVVDARVPRPV